MRWLNKMTYLAAATMTVALAGLGIVAESPVAFRHLCTLTERECKQLPPLKLAPGFDPKPIVGAIPFAGGRIYEADPRKKYEMAILEGRGNCSNLSFGMAYRLLQEDHDFRIVLLLQPPLSRNASMGHTVLQTAMELGGKTENGLLDLQEHGVLFVDGRPARVRQIRAHGFDGLRVERIANPPERKVSFYDRTRSEVAVGLITQEECLRYYAFLSRIYVPLGSRKLEKYLYEGIALLLGQSPSIYASHDDTTRLLKGEAWLRALAVAFLWYVRLLLAAGGAGIVYILLRIPLIAATRSRAWSRAAMAFSHGTLS